MGWRGVIKSKVAILFLVIYLISFAIFLFFSLTEDSLKWQNTTTFCKGNNNLCSFLLSDILPIFYLISMGPFFMILFGFGGILGILVLFVLNLIVYTLLGHYIGSIYSKINRKWMFWVGLSLVIGTAIIGYLNASIFYFELSSEKPCETGPMNLFLRLIGNFDKEECYSIAAVQTKDTQVCGKIATLKKRDQCYDQIALLTQEYAICEEIEDPDRKNVCIKNVALVRNECDRIEVYRDLCYSQLSSLNK